MCWLNFHFLGSCGYTTYVEKLKMGIVSSSIWGLWQMTNFVLIPQLFLIIFGTLLLSFFILFQLHSSFHLCVSSRFLAFNVFLWLFKIGLSVGDIVTLCEYRHRHSKDKRQHFLQRKPWWLLDPYAATKGRST